MLGVLITLLFSVGAACFGHLLIRKATLSCDPALRLGVAGLVGLGAIGTLTLFIGLAPGGLSSAGTWIVVLLGAASAVLVLRSVKYRVPLSGPKGPELFFLLAIGLSVVIALVSVLAPSDTVEWDSLAYHLAVPKLWLQAGQVRPISFIHHSNFPFAVDNLYIWGLAWGGQAGAKAFTLAFQIFGLFAVSGFARQTYGRMAAWWASLAWATIPVVLWLSGTAYIDVQNGLYAGFGILFAARAISAPSDAPASRPFVWLSGAMLGLAAASKYTGLQTIFAVVVVAIVATILGRRKPTAKPGWIWIPAIALVIAAPWYVKNVLWVGNPVYPFFYHQLGGSHWSEWNAEIYSREQQTFGVAREPVGDEHPDYLSGKVEPWRLGHAIFGLAYEPGRYVNPGQVTGQGFPIGSIGFAVIGTLLLWLFSGRASPFESIVIGAVFVSLAMWFVLSEQSRYIIALAVPLSVLAGGAVVRLRAGIALAVGIAVQALISFYAVKTMRFDDQIQVVTGKVSSDDFMRRSTGFYEPSQYLNRTAKGGRVALYDEVFGFLLDVPYFWANPGHTTELGYDHMISGEDLWKGLKAKGITTVYVNLFPPGTDRNDPKTLAWVAAMGLGGPPQPLPAEANRDPDLNWRAKALLAEAIGRRFLTLRQAFGSRLIFTVEDRPPPVKM